jgi:hypothetical protein
MHPPSSLAPIAMRADGSARLGYPGGKGKDNVTPRPSETIRQGLHMWLRRSRDGANGNAVLGRSHSRTSRAGLTVRGSCSCSRDGRGVFGADDGDRSRLSSGTLSRSQTRPRPLHRPPSIHRRADLAPRFGRRRRRSIPSRKPPTAHSPSESPFPARRHRSLTAIPIEKHRSAGRFLHIPHRCCRRSSFRCRCMRQRGRLIHRQTGPVWLTIQVMAQK